MSEFISPDDTRYDERARALVRIGREAIAVADNEKLDRYFAEGFSFHGPDGDMDYVGLRSFFESMRSAFDGFSCERREIISEGAFVAARTSMSGVFNSRFEASPIGPIEPTGKPMRLELINLFRYDEDGRLAEEWVQYDNIGFLRQLGADPTKEH
ncbi:putative ester cyclase [Nocardiopsis arvandica]|uniref:Putative ester cyclase n=1 Tax=Nocardiopsis sinuspersici TaxID=501010 RepID=A0A7Z0BMS0_9ACTN|nr:ester cyclase [Nocardiopsis sinuspersici]NYH54857.1 putative ester cyclase [Nocardiopsis sinuspersici]